MGGAGKGNSGQVTYRRWRDRWEYYLKEEKLLIWWKKERSRETCNGENRWGVRLGQRTSQSGVIDKKKRTGMLIALQLSMDPSKPRKLREQQGGRKKKKEGGGRIK